jgi:hypothetical protein
LALPGLAQEASFLFETARSGLARLGHPFVRREHAEGLDRFEEQFTSRGLAPADCLRDWLGDEPAQALEWARGGQPCRRDPLPLAEALD